MIKNMLSSNFRVFLALLRRDLKVFRADLIGTFIDGLCILSVQILISGYFFPLMGMPSYLIGPFYVGACTLLIFDGAFERGISLVFDLRYNKFINYHLSLPIPKRWLFAEYICMLMIKLTVITLPLQTLGFYILRARIDLSHAHWPSFFFMYAITLFFFATFLHSFALSYSYEWFMKNAWPRRLDWLLFGGCFFVTWKPIYAYNKWVGIAMLANPGVHIPEGLRAALFDPQLSINYWVCVGATLFFCALSILALVRGVYKKLDPV